jgi:hypothetical protein
MKPKCEDSIMTEAPIDEDWKLARKIWACGGVALPEELSIDHTHYLTDLRRAAAIISSAKSVAETDRDRDQSFDELAEQCQSLYQAISSLDDVALARIAGGSPVPFMALTREALTSLDLLEAALRNALSPLVPRKKPQEHNDFLVVVLAGVYERNTERKASVTTNPVTGQREGGFVGFVMAFTEAYFPALIPSGDEKKDRKKQTGKKQDSKKDAPRIKLSPRAIQRALRTRRDTADSGTTI